MIFYHNKQFSKEFLRRRNFVKQEASSNDLGSISPTFYKQITKAQKDSQFKQLFALSGSAGVKVVGKYIDEIDL